MSNALTYSVNTLQYRSNWVLTKSIAQSGMMGANQTVRSRNLLAQNRLNLHVWHGFQEVLTENPLEYDQLTFDARISEDGFLDIILSKSAVGGVGIRLSRNSRFKSQYFEEDLSGKFTLARPFDSSAFLADVVPIRIVRQNGELHLFAHGRSVFHIAQPIPKGLVGFRGSKESSIVDSLSVAKDGRRVDVGSPFDYEPKTFWPIIRAFFKEVISRTFFQVFVCGFLLITGVLIGLSYLVVNAFAKTEESKQKASFFHVFARVGRFCSVSAVYLATAAVAFFAYDYHVYSSLYPEDYRHWEAAREERLGAFERWRVKAIDRVILTASPLLPPFQALRRMADSRIQEYLGIGQEAPKVNNTTIQIARGLSDLQPVIVPSSTESLRQHFSEQPVNPSDKVVVLLGTSQTQGVGALLIVERLGFQLQQELQREYGATQEVIVINLAKAGARAAHLFESYQELFPELPPHTLIANFGNNDSKESELTQAVSSQLQLHQAHGMPALLVAEPVFQIYPHLKRKTKLLRELAEKFQIPFLAMQEVFDADHVGDSGHIWWDNVHLTSYGQSILAKNIASRLIKIE